MHGVLSRVQPLETSVVSARGDSAKVTTVISRRKLESGWGEKSYCLDCISCHKVGVTVFAPKPETNCFLIAKGLKYGVKSPSMESNSVAVFPRKHWPNTPQVMCSLLKALQEFSHSTPTSALRIRDCQDSNRRKLIFGLNSSPQVIQLTRTSNSSGQNPKSMTVNTPPGAQRHRMWICAELVSGNA